MVYGTNYTTGPDKCIMATMYAYIHECSSFSRMLYYENCKKYCPLLVLAAHILDFRRLKFVWHVLPPKYTRPT